MWAAEVKALRELRLRKTIASELVIIPTGTILTVTQTAKSPDKYVLWHPSGLFVVDRDEVSTPIRLITPEEMEEKKSDKEKILALQRQLLNGDAHCFRLEQENAKLRETIQEMTRNPFRYYWKKLFLK
jgi:hypothetical protein